MFICAIYLEIAAGTVKSFYFVGYLITWNAWARQSTKLSTNNINPVSWTFECSICSIYLLIMSTLV